MFLGMRNGFKILQMNQPLISVIITTHNRVSLLKRAIDSVIHQSYTNIECIVVDDASNDETQTFCAKLSNIRYYRIDALESKGGNYARNVGIDKSNGEFIAFLDDDDRWHNDKLEKQIQILLNNPDVGVVFCGYNVVNKKGELLKIVHPFVKHQEDLKTKILYTIITVTSALLIRKNLLDIVGKFDESVTHWQEHELNIRLAQECRFDFVNERLFDYLSDSTDKGRLTNKLEKWKLSVEYIKNKHADKFAKLNLFGQIRFNYMYYNDAEKRAHAIGLKKIFRKYKAKRIPLQIISKVINLPYWIQKKIFNA